MPIASFSRLEAFPGRPAVVPVDVDLCTRFSVTLNIHPCAGFDRSPGVSFHVCVLFDKLEQEGAEAAIAAISLESPCSLGSNVHPRFQTLYFAECAVTSVVIDNDLFHVKKQLQLPWSPPVSRFRKVKAFLVIVSNAPSSFDAMVHMTF